MSYYLLGKGKKPKGPYSESQLRQLWAAGKIPPGVLCCKKGMNKWQPIEQFGNITGGSASAAPVAPAAPANIAPTVGRKSSLKPVLACVVILIVGVLGYLIFHNITGESPPPPGSQPQITSQPIDQMMMAGAKVTFSVAADGADLTYQWRKGGTNIDGATSSTYSISKADVSDSSTYTCVVSNKTGSATSNGATLTIESLEDAMASRVGFIVCGFKGTTTEGKKRDKRILYVPLEGEEITEFLKKEGDNIKVTRDKDGYIEDIDHPVHLTYWKKGEEGKKGEERKPGYCNKIFLRFPGPTGSGFLVTADGYVLTNKHVIETIDDLGRATTYLSKAKKYYSLETLEPTVWVFFGKDSGYEAKIVHVSDEYDFAVLKIDVLRNARFFKLSSAKPVRDLAVRTLGFPGSSRSPMTQLEREEERTRTDTAKTILDYFKDGDFSFVSKRGAVSVVKERKGLGWLIEHDAAVNPGNSGGPLVDNDGLTWGINTWGNFSAEQTYSSLTTEQLRKELEKLNPKPNLIWVP